MFTVTKAFIDRYRNGTGTPSKRQLEILGVPWPLPADWLQRAVGTVLTDEQVDQYIRARKPPPPKYGTLF